MSLLLQALQKASKSREGDDSDQTSAEASPAAELSLEAVSEPYLSNHTPSPDAPTPAQAAAVLRANEMPSYSIFDQLRDRPLIAVIAAAMLFAIGYGVYVYVQIAYPGALRTAPPTSPIHAAAPPATQQGVAGAAESQPAKITGMPSVEPPAVAITTAGVAATAAANSTGTAAATAKTAAVKPESQRRPRAEPGGPRAAPRPVVAAEAFDADSLEVVEIPATQSSAAPPAARAGEEISVRRAPGSEVPVNATLAAAYAALQKGDYTVAQSAYRQVLAADPHSIDALLGLAAIDRKQARTEQASQYYARVLELDPRNAHAQAGLIAMLGGAAPAAAESRLKQLIGREPSGFLYFTLGNLYAEQGQWPSAQQAYFQAFQLQADNPDYAFNLAVGLEHISQSKLALDYYRKALDLSFKKGHANFDQSLAIQRVGQLSARVE